MISSYSVFVRNYDLEMQTNYAPIQKQFIESGIAKSCVFNDINFMLVDMHAKEISVIEDVISNRSRTLCPFIGQ